MATKLLGAEAKLDGSETNVALGEGNLSLGETHLARAQANLYLGGGNVSPSDGNVSLGGDNLSRSEAKLALAMGNLSRLTLGQRLEKASKSLRRGQKQGFSVNAPPARRGLVEKNSWCVQAWFNDPDATFES